MLLSEGKINRDMIALMDKWRHSVFNVSRGRRKKAGMDDQVPCLLMTELGPAECRKNWARLIQKIYEVDPLICPKCNGAMKIIAFIEDGDVIKKILKHVGLWQVKRIAPPLQLLISYDALPASCVDDYLPIR